MLWYCGVRLGVYINILVGSLPVVLGDLHFQLPELRVCFQTTRYSDCWHSGKKDLVTHFVSVEVKGVCIQ